jgi:alkylated DNA repair dioxygenase AlkB
MVEPATVASEDVCRTAGSPSKLFEDAAVPSVHQQGLFDVLAPRLDVDFLNARRIELDETSWIEHVPGWLTGSERLFTELLETAPWEQRDRWMYSRQVTEPRLTTEYPDIASLSLGATRRFLIRPAEGGKSLSFQPGSGDLIVIGGRAQRDWRHCVPKQATPAGVRISVNFSTERPGTPPTA